VEYRNSPQSGALGEIDNITFLVYGYCELWVQTQGLYSFFSVTTIYTYTNLVIASIAVIQVQVQVVNIESYTLLIILFGDICLARNCARTRKLFHKLHVREESERSIWSLIQKQIRKLKLLIAGSFSRDILLSKASEVRFPSYMRSEIKSDIGVCSRLA